MLLLHAYPHRHQHNNKLFIESGTKKAVKVDFEINEHSNIGFDVEMQVWTNLNDGIWKSYPLPHIINGFGIMDKIPGSLDFDDLETDIKQTHHIEEGYCKGRPIMYSAYGYVPGDIVGMFECTFRGRYKHKFTDNWTDWFWIGERDKFTYGQNAEIQVVNSTFKHYGSCFKCGGHNEFGICEVCKKSITKGMPSSFYDFYYKRIDTNTRIHYDDYSDNTSDISRISTPSPEPYPLDYTECELADSDFVLSDFTDDDSDVELDI